MLSLLLPVITHEQLVKPFKFYFEGDLHRGMRFQRKLYTLVKIFPASDRSNAFVFACKICAQEAQTIITASNECYTVWMDLCMVNQINLNQLGQSSSDSSQSLPPDMATAAHQGLMLSSISTV